MGGANHMKQTFREMQLQYDTANFIGIVRPSVNESEEINRLGLGLCHPEVIIEPDDLLIFIAPKSTPVKSHGMEEKSIQYHDTAASMRQAVKDAPEASIKKKKGTLICGWRAVW